jgi:hypothetical protein
MPNNMVEIFEDEKLVEMPGGISLFVLMEYCQLCVRSQTKAK